MLVLYFSRMTPLVLHCTALHRTSTVKGMSMSAILTNPIPASAFPLNKPRNFQVPHKIFARSRLSFGGEFKSVSWDTWEKNQRIFKGSVRIRASTSEEGVPAFEQEQSSRVGYGGLEATLNNLSKWVVASALTAIIIWRHDAEASWAAVGSLINTFLSFSLKRILNQERPDSTLRSDPGMPSSHAQSITYSTTFLILSIVEWCGINALTTTLSGVFVALGSYLTWLRVSQKFHTVSQVIVGATVGSTFSILWFWSWHTYVFQLFASTLWIRVVLILGAIGFILGFINHCYQAWVLEHQT